MGLIAAAFFGLWLGMMIGMRLSAPAWISPLSEKAIRKRGLMKCVLCEGAGCVRELTSEYGNARMFDDDVTRPPE